MHCVRPGGRGERASRYIYARASACTRVRVPRARIVVNVFIRKIRDTVGVSRVSRATPLSYVLNSWTAGEGIGGPVEGGWLV